MEAPVVVREVLGIQDPAFLPAMELYVETFPRDERQPVSSYAEVVDPLGEHRRGLNMRDHLFAAEIGDQVVGMRYSVYDPQSGLGYFVYIAVDSAHRRKGIGQRLVEVAKQQCVLDAMGTGTQLKAIVFECERICLSENEGQQTERTNRLNYFVGRGAKVVSTTYIQPAITPDREPVPLNLMAYECGVELDNEQIIRDCYARFFGLPADSELVKTALEGVGNECPV